MKDCLRAGIIGLGWIATDPTGPASSPVLGTATPFSHCSAIAAEGGIDLVAVADRNPAAIEDYTRTWKAQWPNTRLHADAALMFEEEGLDLLFVGTPDDQHASMVLAALNAGIPMIFCEKPLTTDLDEADNLIRRMDEVGATIAVNHVRRWLRLESAARSVALSGTLGPISQIIIDAGGRRAMLFRNLTHAVDLAVFLAGDADPEWVSAELEVGHEDYGIAYRGGGGTDASRDPGANIQIGFVSGIRAYIAGIKSGPGDRAIQILCPEGRVTIDSLGARVARTTRPPNDAHPNTPVTTTITPLVGSGTIEGIQAGIRDLITSHRVGRDPESSARTARRTVAVMDAVLRSQSQDNARVKVR